MLFKVVYYFVSFLVVCPISVNFTQKIYAGREWRVTKLRNEIYLLCLPSSSLSEILVFEDRNSFRLKKKMKITEIISPSDIGSSEKENCLYVSDYYENCVWKITRET